MSESAECTKHILDSYKLTEQEMMRHCQYNRRIREYNAKQRHQTQTQRRTTPRKIKNGVVQQIPFLYGAAKTGKDARKTGKMYIEGVAGALAEAGQPKAASVVGKIWHSISRLASTHSPMIRKKSMEDIQRLTKKLTEPMDNDTVATVAIPVGGDMLEIEKDWRLMSESEKEAEKIKKEEEDFVWGNGL